MLSGFEDKSATATCIYVLGERIGEEKIFIGKTHGTIVEPSGSQNFGFDACFKPDNSEKTYGEMLSFEKDEVSHRSKALEKLCTFLKNQQ